MAVLARATITLAQTVDIESVTWYYMLQASTAQAPAKPTTATPSGWTTTEPTYTEGSTNNLYICEKTVFSDGTFVYSDVSLSSSYEAAKAAYNKSVQAKATADAAQESIDNLEVGGRNYFAIANSVDGYIQSTGAMHANDSYLEYTCDYIPVTEGEKWTISCTVTEGNEPWIAYAFYDSNKTFIERTSDYLAYFVGFTIPAGTAYIRASYRTHNYTTKCKLEKGNKITDWTPAPEDVQAEIYTAVDNLSIGGRNLIINTLNPATTPTGKRPQISGDATSYVVGSGTLSAVSHGIKSKVSSAARPYLRFGSATASSATLCGLTPGETYTLSFDAEWKALSGTQNNTTYYMRVYLYDDKATTGTLASDQYVNFGTVAKADKGTVMSGRCEFTFTVPSNATMLYLHIANTRTTSSNYASGDYIEVRNLKLEKGNKATDWTPAPEDLEELAEEAKQVATNYVTDTTNGIFVHPENDTQNGVQIQSDVDIIRGGVSVASYGQSARVGKSASAHFLIEDARIAGYNGSNDVYFETGNGDNAIALYYTATGIAGEANGEYFYHDTSYTPVSATVDGEEVAFTEPTTGMVRINPVPAANSEVVIRYTSSGTSGKTSRYFTFGSRAEDSSNGVCTASFGDGNKASGVYSFAEGEGNISTGYAAHAEGVENSALGAHSHAGGLQSTASAQNSFAFGNGVKATENHSAAFGNGNSPDGNIFSVGRIGTGNGLAVENNGDCTVGGRLKSGYTAATAKPMFKLVTQTFTGIGIQKNGAYSATRNISQNGYTPVAVAGIRVLDDDTNGANASWCVATRFWIDKETIDNEEVDALSFSIWNQHTTAQAVVKYLARILYMATNALSGDN